LDLGLARHQRCEDPSEAQRIRAQRRADPVLAGARRVALVEHQVEHLEHRRQALSELVSGRDLKWHARLRECALGANYALRDRALGDEKRARDLWCR